MKDTDIEMVDRYVRGEMHGEELQEFERRLAADADLAAEVLYTERVSRSVKSVAAKKAQMAQWKRDEAVRRMSTNRGPWRVIIVSAAGLALVVVCGLWMLFRVGSASDDRLGSMMPSDEFRGGTGLERIEHLMDLGDYDEALSEIEKAMADTVVDTHLPVEQIEYQRMVLADKVYELQWMRIVALERCGELDRVIGELKEYVNLEGIHQEQAKELLNRLCQ